MIFGRRRRPDASNPQNPPNPPNPQNPPDQSGDAAQRERVGRRLAGHDPSSGHDTAGLPWAGRDVTAGAFTDDDGSADPRLAAVLGTTPTPTNATPTNATADPTGRRALAEALAHARLLVPVVAATAEGSAPGDDTHSDMATIVLTAPDGLRALPVFTSVAALAAWNPTARPVPVPASTAARSALEESCDVLVLDLAGPQRTVPTSMVHALAHERSWQPAAHDPLVLAALEETVGEIPQLLGLEPVDEDGTLVVRLRLVAGLDARGVQDIAGRVADALADPQVRVRLDEVRLQVLPEGPGTPAEPGLR
ncbi:SseB family protein [Arsenicicoccus piscis]|uniref:SseB protein N-terminal domain-containing protein n=1 Tax=Arsenicicoccus piscis TaxID=673954 RepID=A0ABQ6HLM7_9MICO|nr:SseB family protein [Arsenicicoccus piscis]MCH8627082.1 SseB family protein [Arsenicicoccus piscis]GMA18978.1 hypothetical protein GCM10025862_09990 [Arsenicicoccus piscis]